jgi:lipid-A-disaccharide synthase
VHYVCPQVWAWAPWRARKLRRLTDGVACILPFEQDWLESRGVPARYVGHPLMEQLPSRPQESPDIVDAWSNGRWQVAMLAGSRRAEIRNHVPAMLEVAGEIRSRWAESRCTFAARDEEAANRIREAAEGQLPEYVEVETGLTDELLARSHFALAVSGTVTLHAAWFGVPMAVVYRVGRVAYHTIGRCVIRTRNLSLVNILADRPVVPELMPWFGNRRELLATVMEMMEDLGGLLEAREALLRVADSLIPPNGQTASRNAAGYIAELAGL